MRCLQKRTHLDRFCIFSPTRNLITLNPCIAYKWTYLFRLHIFSPTWGSLNPCNACKNGHIWTGSTFLVQLGVHFKSMQCQQMDIFGQVLHFQSTLGVHLTHAMPYLDRFCIFSPTWELTESLPKRTYLDRFYNF